MGGCQIGVVVHRDRVFAESARRLQTDETRCPSAGRRWPTDRRCGTPARVRLPRLPAIPAALSMGTRRTIGYRYVVRRGPRRGATALRLGCRCRCCTVQSSDAPAHRRQRGCLPRGNRRVFRACRMLMADAGVSRPHGVADAGVFGGIVAQDDGNALVGVGLATQRGVSGPPVAPGKPCGRRGRT